MEITKDAGKLLYALYDAYRKERRGGKSKSEANYFGDSNDIRANFFPKWSEDDTSDICWELYRAGLVFCTPGDDLANNVSLTSESIAKMENRVKDGALSVADFISKFIP